MPSLRLAARMIVPPCLTIGKAAGQPLDRLIPGRVERIAGARGDDDVHRVRPPARATTFFDEAHAFEPGLFHVAGADPGDAALAVDGRR